jgi:hypothetical protein
VNYLGIDPGANGGIALIEADISLLHTWKMPESEDDISDLIQEISVCMGFRFCFVEKQGARPAYLVDTEGMHPVQGATSQWTFAEHYGVLKGILATLKIPREFISPHDWQKTLGIPPKRKKPVKETQTEWKNRLKTKAEELFPGSKITLAVSDAILIAEACRRLKA